MTTINHSYLEIEAKAWIKRRSGPDEIIRVIPDVTFTGRGRCYQLFTAYEVRPDNLGRILFDEEGYWIYDGTDLTVTEQEQIGKFIISHSAVQP